MSKILLLMELSVNAQYTRGGKKLYFQQESLYLLPFQELKILI